MSVSPTGYSGSILAKARDMLAASTTFQARVGAADAEGAKAFIKGVLVFSDRHDLQRPFAVVMPAEDSPPTWEKVGSYGAGSMRAIGDVDITITDNARHVESEWDSLIDFLNFLDGVERDIANLNAVNDHLALDGIERLMDAIGERPDAETVGGESFEATFRLRVARS